MNLIVHLPDALAARLRANHADLERKALEALVVEEYRTGRMTKPELCEALGLHGIDEFDGFLKARGVYDPYTVDEIDREVESLVRLGF